MAQKLDDVAVKAGRLIRVFNTERKAFSNANPKYIAVFVEDADGENERCLLFTESQIAVAEARAKRNPEDLTEKTWWTDLKD